MGGGSRRRTVAVLVAAAAAGLLALGGALVVGAATPETATLTPGEDGAGSVSWTGTVSLGDTAAKSTDACFDQDHRPREPSSSGCDIFRLDVEVPVGFYGGFVGGVEVELSDFGLADLDLGVYVRNDDGTEGRRVGGSGEVPGAPERALVPHASGSLYVVAVPYLSGPAQTYRGRASFELDRISPTLDELNADPARLGPLNVRVSRDRYLSHSEPTIAMDPLDDQHLVAASKMYEDLPRYLFKIGTYESFDGGRTWVDQGHLPGYCDDPSVCDPRRPNRYRVTSDPSLAFDDEGNAYINVLDAPGGASGPPGWNMQVHVKRPGQAWSGPITVHDNRQLPEPLRLLLDDKNWIAVDNATTVDGRPNRRGDGQVGTIYVCWSLDGPRVVQQIVLMRSTDGGRTWGGVVPGDNLPYPLSQRGVISGIGCHVSVGPRGEVYVTWYDNVLNTLMQVKSTDRGRTFTPALPIARIAGVIAPFPGQAFRNLSIPTTAVDRAGTVYVAVTSKKAEGNPVLEGLVRTPKEGLRPIEQEAEEAESPEGVDADVILFRSTDGGLTYTGPVRVNQDQTKGDQFQPWIAVTECGQVNISYFDRRNDPNNYFIQTWLSRSNDGGRTFRDVPVGRRLWDPAVKPPLSPSGQFIGDYQGLVADDEVAIPFWNDTQADTLPRSDPDYSPYQEVWAARIANSPELGGPSPGQPCPAVASPPASPLPEPVASLLPSLPALPSPAPAPGPPSRAPSDPVPPAPGGSAPLPLPVPVQPPPLPPLPPLPLPNLPVPGSGSPPASR